MNYKSIPWFPRTWKLFLDHSQPEQALCLKPVASFPILSASAFSFFFVLWNESLCDPSAVSLKSQTWLLRPYRSMANSDLPPGREIYCIPFPFHNSCSRFKRLPKRSQVTRSKAQKRKKKPKLIKLEKTQRAWGKGLVRVGYDPKRVFKFGGIKG